MVCFKFSLLGYDESTIAFLIYFLVISGLFFPFHPMAIFQTLVKYARDPVYIAT
jgi:hypothetical protein